MTKDRVLIPFAGSHAEDNMLPSNDKAPSWFLWRGQPYLICECGAYCGSLTNHSVDKSGNVDASIHAPDCCDWHVWGRLEDWSFGVKEVGKAVPNA